MIVNNIGKNFKNPSFMLVLTICILAIGCSNEDLLDKQPLASLSSDTFWQTENDALLGLTGVYNSTKNVEEGRNFYGYSVVYLDAATDNGCFAAAGRGFRITDGSLDPTNGRTGDRYSNSYTRIAAANNFLQNIEAVEMDDSLKAEMIAEVKFLRAWQYFWLTQFFGDVPLVTSLLTIDEANTVSRTTKSEIVNFILDELTTAIAVLPEQRPDDEHGRIVKAAALALQGRLLMAEERWAEASASFKEIIDSGIYSLHPDYKELFEDSGDASSEDIYSVKYLEDVSGHRLTLTNVPQALGGWNKIQAFGSLAAAYDMTDGLPQDESDLFDSNNPYLNKDPRLFATLFVPGISTYNGNLFELTPQNFTPNHYGLSIKKYTDEFFTGNNQQNGADFKHIRYAEVLLSYLESEFEANGGVATQQLLDETVNVVRARPSVDMPPILLADFSRDRMRSERRVETAWEGLRYWDILRWRIAEDVLVGPQIGAYVGNDPVNVGRGNADGYVPVGIKSFDASKNYLWPIPQTELDINPNLGQNPGY